MDKQAEPVLAIRHFRFNFLCTGIPGCRSDHVPIHVFADRFDICDWTERYDMKSWDTSEQQHVASIASFTSMISIFTCKVATERQIIIEKRTAFKTVCNMHATNLLNHGVCECVLYNDGFAFISHGFICF